MDNSSDNRILPRYSNNVRIGNWVEDLHRENEDTLAYQKTKQKGETHCQKQDKIFRNLLKPIHITGPSFAIQFGDTVQLRVPGFRPTTGSKVTDEVMTLSLHMPEHVTNKHQDLYEDVVITAAHSFEHVVRNCFMVLSVKDATSSQLNYGDEFYLKAISGNDLLLCALPANIGSFEDGLCLLQRKPSAPLQYCRWKAEHFESHLRALTSTHPVPANKQLKIKHCFTNRYLAAIPNVIMTSFGNELEVRLVTPKNQGSAVTGERINWMFGTKI